MTTDTRQWISTLRQSHDRLAGVVGKLSPEQVSGPSYCDEWSVAQVLSHLGSGAEIALLNLEASLAGDPAPSRDLYQEIWDRWNAKSPEAMAADGLATDERHVSRYEGLNDEQLASLSMEFLGRTLDATGMVGIRLIEHAVHTWDVEVTTDPAATVQAEAARLVVDLLPGRMGRLASGPKPSASPVEMEVALPSQRLSLKVGDEVSLTPDVEDAKGRLSLSDEAWLRLTYGRLDAEHTPSDVSAEGPVSLDELRALFPGF